ncbi:MAG TPA: hypothetical protein EYQ24_17550 [Bacteroidetes bacterium]|nr:hypothetical protein [Bacteroidota bacterium]HIL56524.1 hypothetical protein [Rhodothermales bacterium]
MRRVTSPSRLSPHDWASALLAGPAVEPPPPYTGAIHDEFAWHVVKYLADDAVLRSEHAVEPGDRLPGALFTFDFVIEAPVTDASGAVTGMRRVAFEIGGARGLREHERQLRRDASALASGATDAVYRLRGSDLLDHMEDVLYLVAQWDPELFSRRGQINLKTLAGQEVRSLAIRPEQPSALVPYALSHADPSRALWHVANGEAPHVLVRRLDARYPDVWAPYASSEARPEPVEVPYRKAS